MYIYKVKLLIVILCLGITAVSCKKDWLDAKPKKSLVVPNSVANYQALLDNSTALFNTNQPGLGEISADNINFTFKTWQALGTDEQMNAYIWSKNIDNGKDNIDWGFAYNRILSANIVLEGIQRIPRTIKNSLDWDNVYGTALYYRAYDFYNLTQEFCTVYRKESAESDLGIPLKLTGNVNENLSRSTVQQTYNKIISDLKSSKNLLATKQTFPTRPTKAAVTGLLARIYLSMEDYTSASLYADSTLMYSDVLMDYNTLSKTSNIPFKRFNPEVVFHSQLILYSSFLSSNLIVDPALYESYDDNDLRKTLFFRVLNGNITVKAGYSRAVALFGGIATDEIYLIKAECEARAGHVQEALKYLNKLLRTRWIKTSTGSTTYKDKYNNDAFETLSIILNERRKELCYRGLRWTDLRRLNKDERFQKTLSRNLDGVVYSLPANDPRYIFPIPDKELQFNILLRSN